VHGLLVSLEVRKSCPCNRRGRTCNQCPAFSPWPRTARCSTCPKLSCTNKRDAHTSWLSRSSFRFSQFHVRIESSNSAYYLNASRRFCAKTNTLEAYSRPKTSAPAAPLAPRIEFAGAPSSFSEGGVLDTELVRVSFRREDTRSTVIADSKIPTFSSIPIARGHGVSVECTAHAAACGSSARSRRRPSQIRLTSRKWSKTRRDRPAR
jgi:hypothetical protein